MSTKEATRGLAHAIRSQAEDKATSTQQGKLRWGFVRRIDPLRVELEDSSVRLDDEDLVFTSAARSYDEAVGFEKDDAVLLAPMSNGDYALLDVVGEIPLGGGGGGPTGAAGGDLAGTYPNPTIKSSVALTGAPTAATALQDTSTTQLATTAFVLGQAASATPLIDGTAAAGTSLRYARADHVHPTDTTRAPLNSPALTGTPTAPTPTTGDNSTKLATTAFIQATLASGLPPGGTAGGVLSGTYPNPDLAASAAGAGLALASNVLSVNAGDGIQIVSDAVAVTSDVARKNIDNAFSTGQSVTGAVTASGNFIAQTNKFRVGDVGWSASNIYGIAHESSASTTGYALIQSNAGQTYLNAASGASINLRINNVDQGVLGSGAMLWAAKNTFTTTPPTLQLGGGGVAADALYFAYGATSNQFRHAVRTSHDSGVDANNFLDFNIWKIADTLNVVATTRVLRLGNALITASVALAMSSQKITGLANGTAATDAAAFGQIPLASSTTPLIDGTAAVGTGTTWARADHVHPTDTTRAPLASPTFTGTPAAPTATVGTNTTQLATTAFVQAALPTSLPPSGPAGGDLTGTYPNPTIKSGVALAGVPTAATAAVDTNTTQIATTAFVLAQAASATPLMDGTGAVGTSTRFARGDHVHPTDTSRAPLASPTFTGTPAAPTATLGTNTTQLATTAFVQAALPTALPPSGPAGGDLTGTYPNPTIKSGVALAGVPTAATAAVDTSTTQIATTAFVIGQAASATPLIDGTAAVGTSTRFARGDHVHPTDTSRAALASPTFTGTPAAPTAAVDTNTTQIATTAFVIGQAASATPLMDGSAAVGTSTRFARGDHVHPSDTSRAPLASPALTGVPTAPTAAVDTNTTQLATTAFVIGQAASATPLMDGSAAVGTSTRFARGDHVHPTDTTRAPLASPALTGVPTAPTAAVSTNTTQLATTAFVVAQIAATGGPPSGAAGGDLAGTYPNPTIKSGVALTGVPTAATAAQDTNTTQLATTAFVIAQASAATPLIDGTAAIGTSLRYARADHVHPTDTTRAPLASPALTGIPTAPTAAADTSTTQLATTAFVIGQASSTTPLMNGTAATGSSLRYARGDHVHPTDTSLMFGTVDFFGHSMTSFGGTLPVDRGTAERLGGLLHADIHDYTINGAAHVDHDRGVPFLGTYNGDGGWAHVYLLASPEAHAAPYEPRRDGAVVLTGINDLAGQGPTNIALGAFENSLRSSISRLRAAAVFEESDASVVFSATGGHTWAITAGGTFPVVFQSGTSYAKTNGTHVGSTVTISVPTDFPGGTVVFASLCGPAGQGGTFSFTVDAVAAGTLTAQGVQPKDSGGVNTNMWTPVIKRFTGLTAGAHTIVATVTSVSTEAYFDCWWIEAASPPLVNVPLPAYTDGIATHPVNADVDVLAGLISGVVAGFDSKVFSTDLRTVTNTTTDLGDGLHFNDQGHKKAAAAYATDFIARGRTLTQHAEGNADQAILSRAPAAAWDSTTPLNNRVNVIQPTRPEVVALTIRQSAYGDPAAETVKKDMLRFEDRLGTALSGIDYQGNVYVGSGTAKALLASAFGVGLLGLGSAQIAASTAGIAFRNADAAQPALILNSIAGQTADFFQFNLNTTLKARITKDGAFQNIGTASSWAFATYTALTDANPVWGESQGAVSWGPGGASAVDTTLARGGISLLSLLGSFSTTAALTVGNALTVTTGGATVSAGAVALRSGASGTKQSLTLGRTAQEAEIGIAAAANNIVTGSAAGDLAIASSGAFIWVGVSGGTQIASINALGVSVTGLLSASSQVSGSSWSSTGNVVTTGGKFKGVANDLGSLWNQMAQFLAAPTATACVANTTYFVPVVVEYSSTLTGVRFKTGAVAGTTTVGLYNAAGTRVAVSAAGAGVVGINSFNFTGTVAVDPGVYWVGIGSTSATTTFFAIAAANYLGPATSLAASLVPASFTTVALTTTSALSLNPIVQVY